MEGLTAVVLAGGQGTRLRPLTRDLPKPVLPVLNRPFLEHLLRKHPGRVHSAGLSFGRALVFYPEATAERCTAALLLDIDPVGLVRNRRGPAGEGRALEHYVNDRPYVASSFLSMAIAEVFGSALGGKSKERPELVDRPCL